MRNHKMIVNLLKKLCFSCVFGYDSYREVYCNYNSIPVFLIEVFLECLTLVLIIIKIMFNSNKTIIAIFIFRLNTKVHVISTYLI